MEGNQKAPQPAATGSEENELSTINEARIAAGLQPLDDETANKPIKSV
ncbi:hypothetical protein [Ectobacillus ponti]|uniref:Uncharacterized protein n=1 Tax=Ectobacillus ponti TaxID=2961894 RepID=A0AA41X9L8_9BACI|nr:hypothetical protein [Ectobacillus ponti]MCP8969693.1 hypothetical protein [Ectobacillus ponti]